MADKSSKPLLTLVIAGAILVALGVVLSVGADIVQDTGDGFSTTTASNETVSFAANNTWYTTSKPYVRSITCYNDTAQTELIWRSGYTQTPITGDQRFVKLYTNATIPVGDKYCKVTGWDSESYLISRNSTQGIGNLSKWQPTIGTVVAAGAIIVLIMAAMVVGVYNKRMKF